MMHQQKKLRNSILMVSMLLVLFQGATAQSTNQNKESNPVREEIQRYMGYEELLPRYITLPLDASINTNVMNILTDPGFMLLIWLPLLLLMGFRKKPVLAFSTGLLLFLSLVIFSHHSVIVTWDGKRIDGNPFELSDLIWEKELSADWPAVLNARLYQFHQQWGGSISKGVSAISGNADGVTYPIMTGFFLLGFFLILKRMESSTVEKKGVVLFTYIFGFFWWFFSAGIVWYGFLLLPLGLLLLFDYFARKPVDSFGRFFSATFFSSVALFVAINYCLSLTNFKTKEDQGKDIFDAAVTLYQLGHFSEREAINSYYTNIHQAMDVINKDEEGIVYKAGTMLTFLIRKNNRRIWEDNLLDLFNQINTSDRKGNKEEITNAFKRLGIRYLMVGLRLGAIDQTPEGILRKKFEGLLLYLYDNPTLKLLATDNQIVRTKPNSEEKEIQYGVFGQPHKLGTFAVFEIL